MELTSEDRELLLKIARQTVEQGLKGGKSSLPDLPQRLTIKAGVFVTIKKKGRLRGCIGYLEAKKPLYQAVEELALASAFHDTRFPPVTAEELDCLSYEISILSSLEEVRDIDSIRIGVHGLYITRGFNSGLLLPQVAVEHKWDRRTFLEETCRKAGLPKQAWQEKGTKIYSFTAEVVGN